MESELDTREDIVKLTRVRLETWGIGPQLV